MAYPPHRHVDHETGADAYEIRTGDGKLVDVVYDRYPPPTVESINGMTGHVVLTAGDIADLEGEVRKMAIPPELLELQLATAALALGAPIEDAVAIGRELRGKHVTVGALVEFDVESLLDEIAEAVELRAVRRANLEKDDNLWPDLDDEEDAVEDVI